MKFISSFPCKAPTDERRFILKKIYLYISLLFIVLMILVFTQGNQSEMTVDASDDLVVSSKNLSLREGPGLSYPAIDQIKEGQALTVVEEQGEWIYVAAEKNKGWVPSWQTTTNNKQSDTSKIKVAISQVNGLNVRSQPSTSAPVVKQLFTGDEVYIEKIEKNWAKVTNHNEVNGWVSTDYVAINEKESEEINQNTTQEKTDDPLRHFTITIDEINVRDQPNLSSNINGIANKDDEFTVLEVKNNWVKIQLDEENEGWVYQFYGTFQSNSKSEVSNDTVTIIYNGTNLRESPSTTSSVVTRANAGDSFNIVSNEGEWYEIAINSEQNAYVANWVVSTNSKQDSPTDEDEPKANRKKGTLDGLTIVLDPGHGGNDQGTAGYRGTIEKEVTLITAELLKSKLQDAGATVYLTREFDEYIDLRKRVSFAHMNNADAFISLHYDATEDTSISGFTTYYYHSYQQELAQYVNEGLASKVALRNRGAQLGNYLVLRENYQNAILIELGYLSNPTEERIITTDFYREQATLGIYNGILNYFDAQIE